jgi:ribosomal protein S18 acetylase RimI-like enzyme
MIEYKIATNEDIKLLMSSRLEMLRIVNDLSDDYVFPDLIVNESRDYFLNGDQTTVLALDGDEVVGCASMSYMRIMPTFSHPTGKRAHLMNVYTRNAYRRQGIARKMVQMLIDDAWNRGATEVSLDATPMGRPLYESLGFTDSKECMVLTI